MVTGDLLTLLNRSFILNAFRALNRRYCDEVEASEADKIILRVIKAKAGVTGRFP
jgi:hypothetical protein